MMYGLIVLVQNQPGVVAHITGILAAHGFSVESLTIGEAESPDQSLMTLGIHGGYGELEQVRKQLDRIVPVVRLQHFCTRYSHVPHLVTLDPAWLAWNDGCVVNIAKSIDDSIDDSSDIPILGDALEEAGCTNSDILTHCRLPLIHVPGCWVVDLVLQRMKIVRLLFASVLNRPDARASVQDLVATLGFSVGYTIHIEGYPTHSQGLVRRYLESDDRIAGLRDRIRNVRDRIHNVGHQVHFTFDVDDDDDKVGQLRKQLEKMGTVLWVDEVKIWVRRPQVDLDQREG